MQRLLTATFAAFVLLSVPLSDAAGGGIGSLFGGGDRKPPAQRETEHPIRDDATFAEMTTTHTVMPFQRADMYFTISLPKDWETDLLPEDKREMTTRILSDVARFSSPMIGTRRLRVSVQAVNVEHEISTSNWLRNFILSNGFAPDGEITVDPENRRRASAYFVNLDGGDSFYNYVVAQLSGNTIVLARFQSPQNLREYAQFLQKKTVDSFALTYPKEGPIEKQRDFTVMDAVKLGVPESWEIVSPNFKDMNRLNVQFHNKNAMGGVDGFIQLFAIRRHRVTNLLNEVDMLKSYFDTHMNLDVIDMTHSGQIEATDRFRFNRYEIYNVQSRRRGQSRQEVHLVVLGDREWYVILFLLTMREEERLYAWARNVQSMTEIVRSLK